MEGKANEGVRIELLFCFSIVGSCLSFGSTAIVYSFECHAGESLIEICRGHIKIILRQMSSLTLTGSTGMVGNGGGICRPTIVTGLLVLLVCLPAFTWPDRRINAPVTEGSPIDFSKEFMLHCALDTKHPQPLAGVPFKELTDTRG